MDRHDETRREYDDDTVERTGETLELGGSAVPKAPGDPVTEYDEESIRRRRERMSGATDEGVAGTEGADRSSGATGIDMGAGGQGTDTSGK